MGTERMQSSYENVNGTGAGTQKGYRTNIEQIRNVNGSQKMKKAFSRMQTVREHVLQNMS